MISTKAQKALQTYGAYNCRRAWESNRRVGEGAKTIAMTLDTGGKIKTTRQADAAIDAYAEVVAVTEKLLAEFRNLPGEFFMLKGLVCLNGSNTGIDTQDVLAIGLAQGLIAERMDEINRAGL